MNKFVLVVIASLASASALAQGRPPTNAGGPAGNRVDPTAGRPVDDGGVRQRSATTAGGPSEMRPAMRSRAKMRGRAAMRREAMSRRAPMRYRSPTNAGGPRVR